MLLAGWLIVVAAMVLLRTISSLAAFVLAGVGVEVLGLILAVRSHLTLQRERR